ncbi:hypothetical protein BP6252_05328 [Coleophoma cylindrospora]|uniref:J domain-containing protein n=1 Tax=Coleophoma cylindrospora TaxID=1849047 RepID=A0A3D8RTE7_9HELO|nr:hypothetical protein BP6252_05328 [Coleophoma cylindrospora]
MISGGYSSHQHDGLRWPEVTSANAIPTPYQIFNQKKGSKYSKKRFYELVKLYHPDRHEHNLSNDGLSYESKVERYRLVVAANNILSDPVKRGAYDRYGAGWNGQPGVSSSRDSSEASSGWGDTAGWAGGPQGPSQNATWEDWERWHEQNTNGPQKPIYFSNGTYVMIVLAFTIVGIVGQYTRLGGSSVSLLEQRDLLHKEMSKELSRRRMETTTNFGSREERIGSFLKQREPVEYPAKESQDGKDPS